MGSMKAFLCMYTNNNQKCLQKLSQNCVPAQVLKHQNENSEYNQAVTTVCAFRIIYFLAQQSIKYCYTHNVSTFRKQATCALIGIRQLCVSPKYTNHLHTIEMLQRQPLGKSTIIHFGFQFQLLQLHRDEVLNQRCKKLHYEKILNALKYLWGYTCLSNMANSHEGIAQLVECWTVDVDPKVPGSSLTSGYSLRARLDCLTKPSDKKIEHVFHFHREHRGL